MNDIPRGDEPLRRRWINFKHILMMHPIPVSYTHLDVYKSQFHACFLFFLFHFGGSSDLDHAIAAGPLANAFLQLLAVVVRRGFFALRLDLLDARFDA